MGENILAIEGVSKRFPGVLALDHVDLTVRKGEVHVLVGENGAGKSTLVKILCGLYQPDSGSIFFDGREYHPRNTLDAEQAGIRVIFQEFNLIPYLSVSENIFFGKIPHKMGFVDYKTLYDNARGLLREVGLAVSPKTAVEDLGVAQMQLVEIAKAISTEMKLLVMDEPTAALTDREISRLFEIIRKLKGNEVTIIYISHRLREVFEIGDRVTVLRDGKKVETQQMSDIDIPQLVRLMVGREVDKEYPFRDDIKPGGEVLRVENLSRGNVVRDVSFSVRSGEIFGIAGLVGSGRTETLRLLFGADRKDRGRVFVRGRQVTINGPKDAVRSGISLLTEDRKNQGLVLDMKVSENITLTHLSKVAGLGFLKKDRELRESQRLADALRVKPPSVLQTTGNLSGGNQQKVVLAKWLFRGAEVLLFDEPTRGIDVGAKHEIYMLLWELAAEGKGVVIVSSDLSELMGLCHRIAVLSQGRISGTVERNEFNQEKILSLAYAEYLKKRERAS